MAPSKVNPEGKAFRFTRSPAQIQELKAMCAAWEVGPSPAQRFWSFDDVLAALGRPGSLALVHADHPEAPWHGVALLDVGPYTADLLYIYIKPEWRRRGIAHALLTAAAEELATRPQIESMFLEVRISNIEAQKLYVAIGMELVGKRQRYYADGEDAMIYKLPIAPLHPGAKA